MSVRMRHTRGHTNNRRSHHALSAPTSIVGEKGTFTLPHRVDEATGLYRGKQVATPAKMKKSEARTHDHPHGTHHEHAERAEQDAPKPAEAVEAEQITNEEKGHPNERSGV